MEIKLSKMFLCNNTDVLKAVASVTLDDEFVINDIRIISRSGTDKLLVVMPSRLNLKNGKYTEYAHPIKREVREELERVVLEKYKQMTTGGKTNEQTKIIRI